jgi:hypothetical protein
MPRHMVALTNSYFWRLMPEKRRLSHQERKWDRHYGRAVEQAERKSA